MRKKVLTFVENSTRTPIVEGFYREATKKNGWGFQVFQNVDRIDVDKMNLDRYFSDFIYFHDYFARSTAECERIREYLRASNKITINMNEKGSLHLTAEKYYQQGLFMMNPKLKSHAVPTFQVSSVEDVLKLVAEKKLEYPLIVKESRGSLGKGIALFKNAAEVKNFKFTGQKVYIAEPYIEADYDWRVFVIGGVGIGAMRKSGEAGRPENFQAKSGGRERANELDPAVRDVILPLAARAAAASGTEYSGVDIIRDKKTGVYYVLETNFSAGWQNGFIETTGVDVPTEMLKYLEERDAYLSCDKSLRPLEVQKYVRERLHLVSRKAQARYNEIMNFSYRPKIDSGSEAVLERLRQAYVLVLGTKISNEQKVWIRDLLTEVENHELSKYGNFYGADTLEDAIEETALYLSVSRAI